MFKKILFMIPIMGFILTWSGSSLASALYDWHKETLYVPCVNMFDDDNKRYTAHVWFKQLGSSANFKIQYFEVTDPGSCPEYEYPVQLPVEEEEDDDDDDDDEAVQLPVEEDACPNANASAKAKANHPGCTY